MFVSLLFARRQHSWAGLGRPHAVFRHAFRFFGPIPWGHSGPLCSLVTTMRLFRRAVAGVCTLPSAFYFLKVNSQVFLTFLCHLRCCPQASENACCFCADSGYSVVRQRPAAELQTRQSVALFTSTMLAQQGNTMWSRSVAAGG